MKIRAIIFDVYKTLLKVNSAPVDAPTRWEDLWKQTFGSAPRFGLAEFGNNCEALIHREHQNAKKTGILFPEVYWPEIVREIIPELRHLSIRARDEFLFKQAQLWHTVQLNCGAGETIRMIAAAGLVMGVASNAQCYTLRELEIAFAAESLSVKLFDPSLCFWSFENGYSKPDPHVFRTLTMRLFSKGVFPHEILMVGDRIDNDIEPARAAGWQTWLLMPNEQPNSCTVAGDWRQLRERLLPNCD